MTSSADSLSSPSQSLHELSLKADRMVMGVLFIGALAAVGLGAVHGPIVSGSSAALALCLISAFVWRISPGSLASRLTFAICGMLMVALHIQLAQGVTELHFGVFVFLAFLLVYRDWRPVLAAALTIAVHHIAFDQLQALGWPVYCLTAPSFSVILIHASFVIIQTTVEIVIAQKMRADAQEAAELEALCRPTSDGQLNLNPNHFTVSTAAALAVKDAFLQFDHLLGQTRRTTNVVLEEATAIATGNTQLQEQIQESVSKLQETADTIDTIKDSAQGSAREADLARTMAQKASGSAEECGHIVGQVVSAMDSIHHSASKIGDIVSLIDSIAFQTNILALNAAVEAASAREHGKGFAVVASEVRNLAQRSANAAKEVRSLIESSLNQVREGKNLVNAAGESMHSVVNHSTRVTQTIATLSELAHSQASFLTDTSRTVQTLNKHIQANAALIEASSTSTIQLLEQSQQLQMVMTSMRASVQSDVAMHCKRLTQHQAFATTLGWQPAV